MIYLMLCIYLSDTQLSYDHKNKLHSYEMYFYEIYFHKKNRTFYENFIHNMQIESYTAAQTNLELHKHIRVQQ